jgi:hypothetical protein
VQPLLEAFAHKRPGLAGAGVANQVGEAAIELGGLGIGERELAGLSSDAVSEILGKLDALGD